MRAYLPLLPLLALVGCTPKERAEPEHEAPSQEVTTVRPKKRRDRSPAVPIPTPGGAEFISAYAKPMDAPKIPQHNAHPVGKKRHSNAVHLRRQRTPEKGRKSAALRAHRRRPRPKHSRKPVHGRAHTSPMVSIKTPTPLFTSPPRSKGRTATTYTSGLSPAGAPAPLRSLMKRKRSSVVRCFKRSLTQGHMVHSSKYTVVVHCQAAQGKLKVVDVTGDAAQVGSFRRCVKRLRGSYPEEHFSRSWRFTMHLIP